MRYTEIIVEISNASRRLGVYLDRQIKLLDRIMPAVAEAVQAIKTNERDGEYLVRYALGQAMDGDRPILPSDWTVDLNRHYHLKDLRDNLDNIRRYGTRDFLRYVKGTLDYIEPLRDDVRTVLALMPQVEAGFRDYGYTEPDQYDDEYRAARALADAYEVIGKALAEIETMIRDLKIVIADVEKRQSYAFNPDKYRPEHGEIEKLYHASIYASEIAREGFAAEKPTERKGVGNLGDQQLISFTHDIKIAHDIMRALREIWMIVHGQLTRRQIATWINHEGLDARFANSLYSSSSEPPDSIKNTIALYRAYLGLSKLRSDPVFISPNELISQLEDRVITDIGIVACSVRLDGTEQYLHGEAEFRVPASRVVGPIKRVA